MLLRLAAVLLLTLGLAGCGNAPGTDQVKRDLAERLAHAFTADTFEIVSVSARGSARDNTSPPGESRRIVYYDTRLRLTHDIDFGGWNTPGVASLVTLLGAGPKGVQGARSGGNKAGDEIFAHGTAIYRFADGAWQEVAPAGFTLPVAPALDTISPPSASERVIAALQAVVHASPAGTTPAAKAVIDRELTRALATIQARLTRLSQGYPIAAGPEGGQYVRFVQALQATKPLGLTFQALITAGSVDNLALLRQDDVLLAMAQGDVAMAALFGQGPFQSQGPFPVLRALGSLYPEPLHIIVRADSPARSVRDLTHKRIGIGPAGSGTQATAIRVLSAYGLERGRDYEANEAPLIPALAALEAAPAASQGEAGGGVDAVMEVIGTPADEVRTAATAMKLRLLPIDAAVLLELTAKDPALLSGSIAHGSYPGVTEDVPAVVVAALLVTTSALSEAEAAALVKAIYGNPADLLTAGSAQGGQLSVATAHNGVPIPFAAGAEAALRDLGARP
jgi:TRAP transporter TAXI family solute receptor